MAYIELKTVEKEKDLEDSHDLPLLEKALPAARRGRRTLKSLYRKIALVLFACAAVLDVARAADSSEISSLSTVERYEPCSVKSSFLFTKEDASPGSTLLRLPTNQGEKWTLKENGPEGYLELDVSQTDHSRLVFSKSPDIEAISKYSGTRQETLPFVLECMFNGWLYKFKQELIIHDVNEHPPVFDPNRSYNMSISELSMVGSRVFSLRHIASDPDITGRITSYSLAPFNDSKVDGRQYFKISQDGSHVVLVQAVDFDELHFQGQTYFMLNLTAADNGTPKPLSSYATLTIQVTDADDQGPYFVYPDCQKLDHYCTTPYFQTVIKCGYTGFLRLYPAPILAEDKDTLNSSITYSISRVEPSQYGDKFEINPVTGVMKVVKPSCTSSVNEILLTITATEGTALLHSTSTTLQVDLLDNLVIPNVAWSVDSPADRDVRLVGTAKEESPESTTSTTIPLTLFLLSFFGFVTIGSLVVFMAVKSVKSKKKDSSASSTTNTVNSSMEEVGGDCHMCKQDFPTAATCFRSCSTKPVKSVDQATQPSPSTGSLRNKFRTFIQCSNEAVQKPKVGPKPLDIRSTMLNKTTTNPFHFDENIQFRPSPTIPGSANTTGFVNDPNATLGSMKHERGGGGGGKNEVEDKPRRGEASPINDNNRFKLRFNSMMPEIFKAGNPRVRFDTSNLNPV